MGTRWIYEFDARCPSDPTGKLWKVGIAKAKIDNLVRNGDRVRLARAALIKQVLDDTSAIFKGWDRPGKDRCYVYSGNPDKDYRSASIELPAQPPEKMVFLVFVLPDGTIDLWDWRKVRSDNAILPEDIDGEMIWQQT